MVNSFGEPPHSKGKERKGKEIVIHIVFVLVFMPSCPASGLEHFHAASGSFTNIGALSARGQGMRSAFVN